MTDKKFTDDEITKGLECCITFDCRNCPLGSKCNSSPPSLLPFKCAIDLINRQKAEVEQLEQENKVYNEANRLIAFQRDRRDEEIEELHRQITGLDIALKAMRGAANSYKVEIEKLEKKNKILSRNADTAFQDGLNERRELFEPEIKTEAYKEFARKIFKLFPKDKSFTYISKTTINLILKEMIGEE